MGCLTNGTLEGLNVGKGETYKFMNSKHIHLWQRIVNVEYLTGSKSVLSATVFPIYGIRFRDIRRFSIHWHSIPSPRTVRKVSGRGVSHGMGYSAGQPMT